MMSDIFTELEEDIREERIAVLWRKYGNYLIMLAVIIVMGTAGFTLWKYLKHRNQVKAHHSFSQATHLMKQGKKEEAIKAFQDIAQEGGGYGKLAQLYEASLLSNPTDLYTKISQENASDPALSNLAKVLRASHALDNAEALVPIESLTAPNNAWAPLSLELLALNNLKKGDEAKAAEQYIKLLKEPSRTQDEQVRASMMLSQMDIPAYLLQDETNKAEGQK
jgi:hypothetical protein